MEFIFIFLLFCFIGYLWEVILYFIRLGKFVNRGNLYGPWLIVYGFGGLFINYVMRLFNNLNLIVLFIIGLIGCGCIEYFISFVEEKIWKKRWWDYSDKFLNINGRVCFASLFFFGWCSLLFVKLLDKVSLCFNSSSIIIMFILFVLDFIYSLSRPNVGENICVDSIK